MDYQTAIINDFANYPVFDSYSKVVNHFYTSIAYNYSQKIYEIFTTPESVVFWCKKPVDRAEPHWVVLYTNNKYKSGSTISHLDNNRYLKTSGFLMRPSGVRNVILDEYKYNVKNHNGIGDDILCILGTLGYRINYDPSELEEDILEENLSTNSTTDTNDDKNKEDTDNNTDINDTLNILRKKLSELNWTVFNGTYNPNNSTNTSKKSNITQVPLTHTINSTNINQKKSITTTKNVINNNTIKKDIKTSTPPISNIHTTTTTSYEKKFKFKSINAIFKQINN